MYELAAADIDRLAGWPAEAGRFAGPVRPSFPEDRLAIELVVAPADARGKVLSDEDRRTTVRRLVPWLTRRLARTDTAHALVVRLDGILQPGGLIEFFRHLDTIQTDLFSFTGASRLSPADPLPAASVSVMPADVEVLADIASDPSLPLYSNLRLRVFSLPRELAPALLECAEPDDERWSLVLPQVNLFIGPSAGLQSVFVVGPPDAEQLRHLLTAEEAR